MPQAKRTFTRQNGRLWTFGAEERTDFKIKISRLARNGKLSPAGSLWLEVESIAKNQKAGILVKTGASEKAYLDTAAIIIRKFEGVQQYKNNFIQKNDLLFQKPSKI